MSYSHRYPLNCPDCKADLTKEGAVDVHYTTDDAGFDIPSQLDETGLLDDSSGLIAKGYHAGSQCMSCSEILDDHEVFDEYEDDKAQAQAQEDDSWYVRYEGTGEIDGPMPKEEALNKAGDADGMAFSSAIFSSAHTAEALQKLLSAEISKDRAEMIEAMKSVATSEWVIPQAAQELLASAAEVLLFLSSKRTVHIDVRGGVADVEGLPDGVEVIIDDYDIDGSEAELSENSETGEKYHRREFGSRGT